MPIKFNNVPDTLRTPGVFGEVDPSRALSGLAAIPHKALIIAQKIAAGSVPYDTLVSITSDGLADGFFGPGSVAARMCNRFKDNNPNTELQAIVIGSGIAGIAASATIDYSLYMYSDVVSGTGTYYLMLNGVNNEIILTSGMSGGAIASIVASTLNQQSTLPATGSAIGVAAGSTGHLAIVAVNSGTLGNYINIRHNFNIGESTPLMFSTEPVIVSMADGAVDPDLGDAWAVIDGERYNYIIQPYINATNLTSFEDELADRFEPLVDLQGHGFGGLRATVASCTTLGNSRNSPHNTIPGAYDSPTGPEEWAAVWGAIAAFDLNNDPARPLTTLHLKGVLAPPIENRFTQSERNILLYDGIATWIVDSGGRVLIERCITTYQKNALDIIDPTYLDVQTLATLGELRDQFKIRMSSRFIIPRFKLADDGFPVQPGTFVATPSTVKQECIALFTELRNAGLIENLADFIENIVVERDQADRNRVNVLLPPDLINQFRILAGLFQFIL